MKGGGGGVGPRNKIFNVTFYFTFLTMYAQYPKAHNKMQLFKLIPLSKILI